LQSFLASVMNRGAPPAPIPGLGQSPPPAGPVGSNIAPVVAPAPVASAPAPPPPKPIGDLTNDDLQSIEPGAKTTAVSILNGEIEASEDLKAQAAELVKTPSDSPNYWRMLLDFGLSTMVAGGAPGATFAGSVGRGAIVALHKFDKAVKERKVTAAATAQRDYDRGRDRASDAYKRERDTIGDQFKKDGLELDAIKIEGSHDVKMLLIEIKHQTDELDRKLKLMQIGVMAERAVTDVRKMYADQRATVLMDMPPLPPDDPGYAAQAEELKKIAREEREHIARILRAGGKSAPGSSAVPSPDIYGSYTAQGGFQKAQ